MVMAWIATRPPGDTSRRACGSRWARTDIPPPRSSPPTPRRRSVRRLRGSPTVRCRPGRTSRPPRPAACASRCCSADSVTERTCAPRGAARIHSSPQPVPISSTRLPGPTRAASSSRSILRRCASARSAVGRGQLVEQRAGVGHRLVEELGEQFVGQVVVLGDVVPGLLTAVVLRSRLAHHRDRAHPLQRSGTRSAQRRRRTRSARRTRSSEVHSPAM